MKIERVTFIPHRLERKVRWQTASYSADGVDVFYVEIETGDGPTGIGAASVMSSPRGESLETGLKALESAMTELFLGRDPFYIEALMLALERSVPGYPRHKVALEMALHDLVGKAQNVSVSALLGGANRSLIPVLKMVGMGPPEWMAERAAYFVSRGYRHLKIKLGAGPERDRERFRAVRKAVGSEVILTGDFNGAYDPPTAIDIIESLASDGLTMAEQPVAAGDLEAMAAVTRTVQCIVLADQSVNSPKEVSEVARLGATKAVSIKLLKLGGIRKSRAVTEFCQASGLSCHVGGTATSRLVEAAQAHFIAAVPGITTPSEIGEFEELDGDLVEGLEVENGAIRVPTGPGLGMRLRI